MSVWSHFLLFGTFKALEQGVLRELQRCVRGVSLKLQGCLVVSRMSTESFQGASKKFIGFPRKFQGKFKGVSRKFKGVQVRLKGISSREFKSI